MGNKQITLSIPDYSRERGIRIDWIDGFDITVEIMSKETVITANKEGLISLAKILLTLAQDEVSSGSHVHLDQYNSLEDNSSELILVRK